jgi:hypothetical protein
VTDLVPASFRFRIGSALPQLFSLLGSNTEFLWTPLHSPTFSLLTGQWPDFHQLADYHASRTATLIAAFVTNNGRSAWFVGVLLLMVYLIFAMTLYLLPPRIQ